jgi:hypothetical protein
MKRVPFEPPTEHYDKRIEAVDEQICHLIKQRKELSNNNPGFPTKHLIAAWSKKYNLDEEFVNSVFGHFLMEDMFRPVVEPKGFLKNIPILKSFEKGDLFYSVTLVRQYENASVVHFNIDRDDSDEQHEMFQEHPFFELSIQGGVRDYECRNEGGGGSRGHMSFTFIVSPPLPDDLAGLRLVFKECKSPFQKPTGFEFAVEM